MLGRDREWRRDGLFLATGKYDLRNLPRPRRAGDPALGLRLRLPASAAREALLAGSIELHLFAGGYAGVVLQEDGSAQRLPRGAQVAARARRRQSGAACSPR